MRPGSISIQGFTAVGGIVVELVAPTDRLATGRGLGRLAVVHPSPHLSSTRVAAGLRSYLVCCHALFPLTFGYDPKDRLPSRSRDGYRPQEACRISATVSTTHAETD